MGDLKQLSVVPTAVDKRAEDCVDRLEEVLQHARAHPMRAVAILTVTQDGSIHSAFSCESCVELVGALEMLKTDVITRDDG